MTDYGAAHVKGRTVNERLIDAFDLQTQTRCRLTLAEMNADIFRYEPLSAKAEAEAQAQAQAEI